MRPVFESLDYREILREAYEERKLANPFFSYRFFGDLLGLDASNIFRILRKDAHLPARCQHRTLEFLELSGREAEYFQALIAYAREKKEKERGRILEQAMALRDVAQRRLADHELSYYKHWWTVAIRSLVEVIPHGFVPSEIARRLAPAVSEDQARDSLDLLLELGLVHRSSSDRYTLPDPHIATGGPCRSEIVREHQRQILALASESLGAIPKGQRDISTLTFAVDDLGFREIREMLRETRRLIQLRIERSKAPDRVLQLAMALFPLAPAAGDVSSTADMA